MIKQEITKVIPESSFEVNNIKVISDVVYFERGGQNFTVKLTKTGKIKKNSFRLASC